MALTIPAIKPGRYVIGVSGGVDSVVLLDMLHKQRDLELVVAHFDHGIRKNSQQDRTFVHHLAMSHNLTFEFAEGKLGSQASEEVARNARYNFLRHISKKYNAAGIILAHHQDDLLETAVINLLRGTGWRGLTSLQSHPALIRPLLNTSKAEILAYAKQLQLDWREDATNLDTRYLRNYVRHVIFTTMSAEGKEKLRQIIVRQHAVQHDIAIELQTWLTQHAKPTGRGTSLPRYQLIMQPTDVALESLQAGIREVTGKTLERPLARRALLFCKAARLHRRFELNKQWQLRTAPKVVIVEPRVPVVS